MYSIKKRSRLCTVLKNGLDYVQYKKRYRLCAVLKNGLDYVRYLKKTV